MNPNTEELIREVVLMFEAEFGKGCVEIKDSPAAYIQGKVTWDTYDDMKYMHEQDLPYDEDEIVSQLTSVYWMVVGKEPNVNRTPSQRGNSVWSFTTANEPKLELRVGNSGAIWFWIWKLRPGS